MPELTVVVPTRSRPSAVEGLVQAFRATCTADTEIVFALDSDDPAPDPTTGPGARVVRTESSTMVQALNAAAVSVDSFAIGFMGDDHMPRTVGWDSSYLDALRELGSGMVYGNDLFQGAQLPTQIAMTADIVRALGYMVPPSLTHLFVDNAWLDWGRAADCITYLRDVVVEHRHPVVGKAAWDEGYRRVNDPSMYDKDRTAYANYLRDRFTTDVAKIKALRRGRAA